MKKTVTINPEFGIELVLATPYIYWLYKNNQLEKVVTSKDMAPFYYFCNNVEEKFDRRTHNNALAGLNQLPNNWLHHNAIYEYKKDYSELTEKEQELCNGRLDYRKWSPPPYKEYFFNRTVYDDKMSKFIVVLNRYNYEHEKMPTGFFDIDCLKKIFQILTGKGYQVVYVRPRNNEFPNDEGERNTLLNKLDIYKNGLTDYNLARNTEGVDLLVDLSKYYNSYNEMQLNIYSYASGFISIAGGVGILGSYFGVPNIIYTTTGKEIRPGYFDKESYYRKLSNAPIHPVIDKEADIRRRGHDYSELLENIKNVY